MGHPCSRRARREIARFLGGAAFCLAPERGIIRAGCGVPTFSHRCASPKCLARYVLERATLGGKLISANLARVLGIGPENGASFFASYGARVASQWQLFCVALEKSLSDVAARNEAALSAVATFELFNECIEVPESERFNAISPAATNAGP